MPYGSPELVIALVALSSPFVLFLVTHERTSRRANACLASDARERTILAHGIRTPARIRQCAFGFSQRLGKVDPVTVLHRTFEVELEIHGHRVVTTFDRVVLADGFTASLQPGAWIEVAVDPANPARVAPTQLAQVGHLMQFDNAMIRTKLAVMCAVYIALIAAILAKAAAG